MKSNITKIKKTDELPFIPELLRDFAFKYAMDEYKSQKLWAGEYGVSVITIGRWLKHAGMQDYILICQDAKKGDYLEEIRGRLRDKMMHLCGPKYTGGPG